MFKNKLLLIILGTLFLLWLIIPPTQWKITDRFVITIKPASVTIPFVNKTIPLYREPKLGLDLKGGTRLVFGIDTEKLPPASREEAAQAARDVIERRINFFGVSEPNITMIQTGKNYRIIVELPGVASADEAVRIIGQTAQLDFREYSEQTIKIGTQSAVIPNYTKTKLTGALLSKASIEFNQQTGDPQVLLRFNPEGKKLFAEITKKNIKKPLAIFLDESILTAPIVQDEITDGVAVISGKFAIEDAKRLANALNAGALPAPARLLERSTVAPTVGTENIQKSVVAGIVGIISVMLFMLIIYKKNGVLAIITLLIYAIITLFIYEYSGMVLTLSGIAGLFLSVGMAVDANILIYERIKEETFYNHSGTSAVVVGYKHALSAIREANINTLLIALVLFNPFNFPFLPLFGSVRGFAATLAIGVIVGYFTGVVITKNLLWAVYKIPDSKHD